MKPDHYSELTFVVKNPFFKEKANLISTGDKIVSTPLQGKKTSLIHFIEQEMTK